MRDSGSAPSGGKAVKATRSVICALGVVAAVVFGPPAHARTTLKVEAGFDGWHYPGVHVPVRVEVAADRLVRGKIMINVRDDYSVTRAVEIPGGSVKTVTELAPSGEGSLNVRLLDQDGRTIARRDVTLRADADSELVGLLPHVLRNRPLPGVVPLAVDVGTARFVRLDPALLERAPIGLFSVGTIGATEDDLSDLSRARVAGLARWVHHGGRLLVDAPPGTRLPRLPEEWQPGRDGRAFAGTGEIVLTGDALRSGRFNRLIEPTSRIAGHGLVSGVSSVESPYSAAAARAQFPSPPLSALWATGAVYAILAGPALWLILRRSKRELAMWVAVPVLAVALTTIGWATATYSGPDIAASHQTRLETAPDGMGSVDFYTAVAKRNGGELTVTLPRALWAVGSPRGEGGGSVSIRSTSEGPAVRIPLNPRQIALAAGPGRPSADVLLTVTATTRDGRVEGTVRNDTPYELSETAVIVGAFAKRLGSLSPGATEAFSIAGGPALSRNVGSTVWGPRPHENVGWPLWASAADTAFDYVSPGSALAVGFTRAHRVPVVVDGRRRVLDGHTMITGRAPVRAGRGSIPSAAIHVEQVRGPVPDSPLPGALEIQSRGLGRPIVLRVTLPEGRLPASIELRGPDALTELEIWRDGAWDKILDRPPSAATMGLGRGPATTYPLGPPGGRVLYLRALEDPSGPDIASAAWYMVRESAAAPEAQ